MGHPPSPALRNTNNLVRRPEGRSPPGTSRTQGQAGRGQGGQTRGLSRERKCRPRSHPSLTGPHVCLQMKDTAGGLPPLPGPQGAHRIPQHLTQSGHLPAQTRWPEYAPGFGGKTSLQIPCKLSMAAAGGWGGPRPTQELWDKGRQGSLLPCWGGKRPWPSTQATTDPLHNGIGGGGRVLATLTQPTFGFQERKKRVCYFPATHSSFLCDVCTVRHTRQEKCIHASLTRPVSFTWTGKVHEQGLSATSLLSSDPHPAVTQSLQAKGRERLVPTAQPPGSQGPAGESAGTQGARAR